LKKTFTIAFCIVMLCSLLLAIPANAGNAAYPMTEYQWIAAATIDGMWTTADEWNDGPVMTMSNNASFTYNMDFTTYAIEWLVEIFTDNTNNTGDYWQICLDPDNSGGATPQTGDFKIEIQGHTTLKVYQGTGTGWTEITGANELTWANTISPSTWNSTPHWILEITDPDKTTGTIQTPAPTNGMRVAAYDATTGELASWAPNSNANVPDQYGIINNYSQTAIPESLSFGLLVLLSSAALIVGSFCFRKKRIDKQLIIR
jgi:hypothetical protein